MMPLDESNRPAPGTFLCTEEEIEEAAAKGFQFGDGASAFRLFLVRHQGQVRAYISWCPHLGTPLAYLPDQFLTEDGKQIVCATHGAQFRPDDGYCTSGPCEGRSLRPFPITIESGNICVGSNP